MSTVHLRGRAVPGNDWGGVSIEALTEALTNGTIMIPHIAVQPTGVEAKGFASSELPPPEVCVSMPRVAFTVHLVTISMLASSNP